MLGDLKRYLPKHVVENKFFADLVDDSQSIVWDRVQELIANVGHARLPNEIEKGFLTQLKNQIGLFIDTEQYDEFQIRRMIKSVIYFFERSGTNTFVDFLSYYRGKKYEIENLYSRENVSNVTLYSIPPNTPESNPIAVTGILISPVKEGSLRFSELEDNVFTDLEITIADDIVTGTFRISLTRGAGMTERTQDIRYNESASGVAFELNALPIVSGATVTKTGNTWSISFGNTLYDGALIETDNLVTGPSGEKITSSTSVSETFPFIGLVTDDSLGNILKNNQRIGTINYNTGTFSVIDFNSSSEEVSYFGSYKTRRYQGFVNSVPPRESQTRDGGNWYLTNHVNLIVSGIDITARELESIESNFYDLAPVTLVLNAVVVPAETLIADNKVVSGHFFVDVTL